MPDYIVNNSYFGFKFTVMSAENKNKQVMVNVFRDAHSNYIPGGTIKPVECDPTKVSGTVYIATERYDSGTVNDVKEGDEVESTHPVAKMAVIKIGDHVRGLVYTDETKLTLEEKCNACCTSVE